MIKAHLITAATALSIGIGGTLATNGITASAAVPLTHRVSVRRVIPNSNTAVDAIWTRVASSMCSAAETESGFDNGSSSVEEGTTVSFSRGATDTTVIATFAFAATVTKGAPQ